jgi:NAD(P)-dependent dehydrogenase (short-subunit alcohol dehydrogenase family)
MAVGRDEGRLVALGKEARLETLSISLESAEACERAIEETHDRLGPVAILVNNAGRGGFLDKPIWEESRENWRATLAINLDTPFELTRLAARDMKQIGWGRVIMVSSTAGQVGAPGMVPYCASKHGILGLMRAAAHDLAKIGATCNAVLPGWVRTEMAEQDAVYEAARRGVTVAEIWAERAAAYPGGKVLEPEDIARVIGFLASEEAAAINAEAVSVTHGGLW